MTIRTWLGSGSSHSGAWETATDWSPGGVPKASDTAAIDQGVATDDVNQTLILPNNTINPGDEISALDIGAAGGLVIGDAAGANFAIFTLIGSSASTVLGSIVIDAGGASGSELRASGTIHTSASSSTHSGTIDIRDGKLLALGTLTVDGGGAIAMDGGYIGGSSAKKSDTFINRVTISGVGDLSAANYYAAPPAIPLSGPLNYHGLVTYNYGVIDATNVVAGANYFTITGGVTYNYGTLEATNSVAGSTGYAALGSNEGAVILNEVGGVIAARTGAYVTLGASVTSKGELIVDGGYMTFTSAATTTGQDIVKNGGYLTFDASASVGGVMTIYANSGVIGTGTLKTSYGNADGTIDIDKGTLFALGSLTLSGAGAVDLNGGFIGGDSLDRVDTFVNRETISGFGFIDAYNVFGGVGVYNGLNTSNYGTIEATNVDAGQNVLGIVGGDLHNYGNLEANDSVAGSTGTASIFADHGAVIVNSATGVMDSGSGAFIALSGATVQNGELIGQLSIFDTGNVIESTTATTNGFVNHGEIYVNGVLTLEGQSKTIDNQGATIQVNAGGALYLRGDLNSTAGTLAVDGGAFTAEAGSLISDSLGKFVIGENDTGGSATLFSPLLLGSALTSIMSGTLTLHASVASEIYDNGVLGIGTGGDVTGFIGLTPFGAIDLDTVKFKKSLTGEFTQASATSGVMKVAGQIFEILGDYQSVGTTTSFGVDGGVSGFYIQADSHFHNVAQIVYRLNIGG